MNIHRAAILAAIMGAAFNLLQINQALAGPPTSQPTGSQHDSSAMPPGKPDAQKTADEAQAVVDTQNAKEDTDQDIQPEESAPSPSVKTDNKGRILDGTITVPDGRGGTVSTTYKNGKPVITVETKADGTVITTEHNVPVKINGKVVNTKTVTIKKPDGSATKVIYNIKSGKMIERYVTRILPDGTKETIHYDKDGNILEILYPK